MKSIVISGTKQTIKQNGTITNLMTSIRSYMISPQKGNKNPPHIHIKIPKAIKGQQHEFKH